MIGRKMRGNQSFQGTKQSNILKEYVTRDDDDKRIHNCVNLIEE